MPTRWSGTPASCVGCARQPPRAAAVSTSWRSPPRSVTVLQAIEERLNEDLGDETEATIALTAKADPVLAELWDNPRDAECHRHSREIPGGRAADVGSA